MAAARPTQQPEAMMYRFNFGKGRSMPMKRRTGKRHAVSITPEAVALFERGMRLRAKEEWSSEIAANAAALGVALGLPPWAEDVFDCPCDDPPDGATTEFERADY